MGEIPLYSACHEWSPLGGHRQAQRFQDGLFTQHRGEYRLCLCNAIDYVLV